MLSSWNSLDYNSPRVTYQPTTLRSTENNGPGSTTLPQNYTRVSFSPSAREAGYRTLQILKRLVWTRVKPRLAFIENHFDNQGPYLMGNQPCIADPYLFVMTNRMKLLNYSFEGLPNLKKLDEIMRQHPAVKRVLEQEGAPHTLTDKN